MRILHILTHASHSRRFGGPNTVAMTQAQALTAAGHHVVVAAGSNEYEPGRQRIEDVDAMIFPSQALAGHRWAGRRAIGMTRWVAAHQREFDICHVHLARDLTVLPAARAVRIPYVVQPHGMLTSSSGVAQSLFDRLLVTGVVNRAGAVLALSIAESNELQRAFPMSSRRVLPNAIRTASSESNEKTSAEPRVLYLARVHRRKRPLLFVEAAEHLLKEGVEAEFLLVGPDDGEGEAVASRIAEVDNPRIRWVGAVPSEDVPSMMKAADVYVLPAEREPFGLTLLEAAAAGCAVVAAADSVVGAELQAEGLAHLFDGSAGDLSAAIAAFLNNNEALARIRQAGPSYVRRAWGIETMTKRLASIYQEVGR